MRKPRDFDAELKALDDKTRTLKERKLRQLGELVIATGADALEVEVLAGVLLNAAEGTDLGAREGLRRRGAGFFRGRGSAVRPRTSGCDSGDAPDHGGTPSAGGATGEGGPEGVAGGAA